MLLTTELWMINYIVRSFKAELSTIIFTCMFVDPLLKTSTLITGKAPSHKTMKGVNSRLHVPTYGFLLYTRCISGAWKRLLKWRGLVTNVGDRLR